MSVMMSKCPPVVVRPSVPVITPSSIKLSPFDKGLDAMPATFFFSFDRPIHKPTDTIKRALSQALVHYYPFAGRLAPGAGDGELCIQCSGEGVAFVAASANCTLMEAKFYERSLGAETLLSELAMGYPAEGHAHTHPLLMMQVTEFSCGGFVIGVTWNHAVADGAGMAQFLQAVGELARGMSAPTIVPIRSDDSLPNLPPLVAHGRQMMTSLEPRDFTSFDVTIPYALINKIKSEFMNHSNGQKCTVFEAVTAALWRCRTRAIITDPEAPSMLVFVANVHKLIGAKDGYYGNCITVQMAMATTGMVANGDILDLVQMIKRGKELIREELKSNCLSTDLLQVIGNEQLSDDLRYNLLSVSCMRNLGLDKPDFGSGMPARVMCRAPQMALPACVTCLPWEGRDGASVFLRCVKEQHAEAFLRELARMMP